MTFLFLFKAWAFNSQMETSSKNPIKINSSESRNAGIIFDKKKLIRVSQEQGFDNYGQNINFHEIKSLNTKKYLEKIFINKSYLRIKKKLNNSDIHHYSKTDENIIVDFK